MRKAVPSTSPRAPPNLNAATSVLLREEPDSTSLRPHRATGGQVQAWSRLHRSMFPERWDDGGRGAEGQRRPSRQDAHGHGARGGLRPSALFLSEDRAPRRTLFLSPASCVLCKYPLGNDLELSQASPAGAQLIDTREKSRGAERVFRSLPRENFKFIGSSTAHLENQQNCQGHRRLSVPTQRQQEPPTWGAAKKELYSVPTAQARYGRAECGCKAALLPATPAAPAPQRVRVQLPPHSESGFSSSRENPIAGPCWKGTACPLSRR